MVCEVDEQNKLVDELVVDELEIDELVENERKIDENEVISQLGTGYTLNNGLRNNTGETDGDTYPPQHPTNPNKRNNTIATGGERVHSYGPRTKS